MIPSDAPIPTPAAVAADAAAQPDPLTSVQGRSVFAVETTQAGVTVQTAFLTEHGQLLAAPAVFLELTTALAEIDQLRLLVIRHFDEAARLGAQLIAAEAARRAQAQAKARAAAPAADAADATPDTGAPTLAEAAAA